MSNYIDRYGLYNVEPVIDGEPSGNDGWIMTAYADKLGFPVDHQRLYNCFQNIPYRPCSNIPVQRLPDRQHPYVSRDVILGWYWMGLITVDDLIDNNWSFSPYEVPKFNLVQFICQSILCLYEHRNYFWKHEFGQIYRMAFTVPLQDRAYMLRDSGMPVSLRYRVWEWVSDRVSKDSDSGHLIGWRKGKHDLDSDVLERYFGANHPFVMRHNEARI